MEVVELTDDNVEDYEDLLPDVHLANIGRKYHRGMIASNGGSDSVCASLFWNLKNAEIKTEDTISEMLDLASTDPEGCDLLLTSFDGKNQSSGVKRAAFEFAGLEDDLSDSLKKYGFDIRRAESRDIIVTVADMAGLAFMKKQPPQYIKALSQISGKQFARGIMACVMQGRYGLEDDLPFLPLAMFDGERSSCVVTDNTVNGFLLVKKVCEGMYLVELLCALGPDAKVNLLNMMRYSVRAALKFGSQDDRIILRRHTASAQALTGKLFPGRKGEQVIRGEKNYG